MNPPTRAEIRSGLARLSSLSPAVQSILPRLADDRFNVNELGRLVAQDPILAARVLRLANSPFYGLPRQVGSLQEAVVVLGFSNLRSMVLSAGLIGAFSDSEAISRSLAIAAAARSLAKSLRLDQGMAFTAGLLHNLGALLLGHFAPDRWQALSSESMETAATRLLKEREIFGFDHCELGAEIAGDWRFPDTIQTAIRSHPLPPDDPPSVVTDLVHTAWVISSQEGSGEGLTIAPAVMRRLDLASPEGVASLAAARQAAQASHGAADTL
jgi:putative nucleotidyltransferase with HDIG domain